MNLSNFGIELRMFLRNAFGSRAAAQLEATLQTARDDYETRLDEQKQEVSHLRQQVATLTSKVERYEMYLLPMVYKTVLDPRPKFEGVMERDPDSWEEIQRRHYEAQNKTEEKPSA